MVCSRRGAGRAMLSVVCGALFAVLVAPSVTANVVADSGFESWYTAVGPMFGPMPSSIGFWSGRGTVPRVVGSPAPVFNGSAVVEIDTRSETYGSLIIQDVDLTAASYVWTFWVYRSEGKNAAEVIRNWDRGVYGAGNITTRLDYNSTGVDVRAWDGRATLLPIGIGMWHEVKVVANACDKVQDFLLDGTLWGRVQATTVYCHIPYRNTNGR